MTIRTDVSIDWGSSPRVLTVAAPSVEITIQDLFDTCKYFEDTPEGESKDFLISAGGKEFLGGTTYVGITATLNNAVLSFEARGGPSWVLCTISGGNLVAVNDVGTQIDPRLPTAYVSVDRTASASATLQEQDALQYASYGGGVTVDLLSSYSGTDFPTGTEQEPVNNFTDALAIAADKGFGKFYIKGDATINSGIDFQEVTFIGESKTKSEFTIDANADVSNCEFYDATISGTLDGGSVLRNCLVINLNYINGYLEQCILGSGTILLGGSEEAHIIDCHSGVVGTATPIVDMGGSGQNLGLRNYNGGIEIRNLSGSSNKVSLDMNSGQIVLHSTVSAGTIVCRGLGNLTDNSTGTATVYSDELLDNTSIATAVWADDMATFLLKVINNKKAIEKSGSVWELIIYDDDNSTPIMSKALKDKDGNNISDLEAGTMAQELQTSV